MKMTHSLTFAAMTIAALSASAIAQERWQRLPPKRDEQFYAPRNHLEELESRQSTVLIKGRTWVATLRTPARTVRVEATEIRDAKNQDRATGVTLTLNAPDPVGEVRCLIDYDEIDPLVRAFDTLAKADDSIVKLTHFELHYRTRADFELIVFKQTSGGIAAAIEGGYFDRARVLLTLEEFTRLRWMIVQAKEKLDEIK
jgi:hypothetical protein